MTTAGEQSLKDVATAIGEALKPYCYRKVGHTFNRSPSDSVTHVMSVCGQRTVGGVFYILTGVHLHRPAPQGKRQPIIKEIECTIRGSVSGLVPDYERYEDSQPLSNPDAVPRTIEMIERYVLPWFNHFPDEQTALDVLEDQDPHPGRITLNGLTDVMVSGLDPVSIRVRRGELARAQEVFNRFLEGEDVTLPQRREKLHRWAAELGLSIPAEWCDVIDCPDHRKGPWIAEPLATDFRIHLQQLLNGINDDSPDTGIPHEAPEKFTDTDLLDIFDRWISRIPDRKFKRGQAKQDQVDAYRVIIRLIQYTKSLRAVEYLLGRLTIETDRDLLGSVLYGIGEIDKPAEMDLSALFPLLTDRRWSIRHAAIKAFEKSRCAAAEPRILNAMREYDKDKYTQIYGCVTLGGMGITEDSIQVLRQHAKSSTPDVRDSAKWALTRRGEKDSPIIK